MSEGSATGTAPSGGEPAGAEPASSEPASSEPASSEPAEPARGDLAATPMRGPFAAREDLCSSWRESLAGEEGLGACEPLDEGLLSPEDVPETPETVEAVVLLQLHAEYSTYCALTLRTSAGLFLRPLGVCSMEGSGEDFTSYDGLTFHDVGGEGPYMSFVSQERSLHMNEGGFELRSLHLCRVRPAPDCVDVLMEAIGYGEMPEGAEDFTVSGRVARRVTVTPAGHVRVAASGGSGSIDLNGREVEPLPPGTYRIVGR